MHTTERCIDDTAFGQSGDFLEAEVGIMAQDDHFAGLPAGGPIIYGSYHCLWSAIIRWSAPASEKFNRFRYPCHRWF